MKNILLTIVLLAIPCFLNAQGRHMVSDSVYAYWNTNYPTYGDGGPATAAALAAAQYFATNSSGDIFIGDVEDFRIRKISHTTGIINTIAGYGVAGYSGDGGPGGSARINGIGHMCTDRAGNLYFADDSRIRKVNASTGIITTICGNGTSSFSGDGGPATAATVISASFLCMDHADNLYFVDYSRVRKIDAGTGIITTLAGNGSVADSGDGGPATAAALCYCNGLCVDWNRNIYFANGFSCQSRIRKIDTFGIITNYAGGGATIINGGPATATYLSVESLGTDSLGNLYVQTDGDIRKINYNTGIINKVYSGYYFDKGILVKDNGDIFLNSDPWVQLLKGARSGIDTWTVFDSASHCGLPGSLAFGLNGISTDTPSVTDSILITIDAADDYYPRYRYKHLPYNYTSGAYQFLDSTWRNIAPFVGGGQYARAKDAPWWVQDDAALWMINNGWRSAWNGTGC
ncbi:MAG: hypothetical protein EBZ77_05600 [Chitinophagia bacterium]|nr:hypothetical protein [Chitinophagia bacterium]